MTVKTPILLLPDAGPLITLAYADALDVMFKPGWAVQIVDMVLHEVTRNQTPTSQAIAAWVEENKIQILPTRIFQHYQQAQTVYAQIPRKSNLGELAIQEVMTHLVLINPPPIGVFLFEDHKIASSGFVLPENCRKVSTRAFLTFLEQKGWLASAAELERKAIQSGRHFSQLRFPAL
jgi:hypothetical protein